MNKIKCAFCGSPVTFSEYEEIFSNAKLYNSVCYGCGATFPGSASKELLIKKWKCQADNEDYQAVLAEQQLLGFFHSNEGHSLESLIQSMGLKYHEWDTIKETYFFTKRQKEQVDRYFEKPW